jgi:hypothetical protein
MARKGRAPWSTRLIVEDCLAFDIANLVRSGVFRAKTGSLFSIKWKNRDGQETFRAYFWMESTASAKTLLHVSHGVPSSVPLMHYARTQSIEIAQTALYFGLRPWFLCPAVHDNIPCRRRVRFLYLPPNAHHFGCRNCHNLIHRSAREHDKRVDALLRLPIEEFRAILRDDTIRLGSLAFRAGTILQRRLEKKAARYSENRGQKELASLNQEPQIKAKKLTLMQPCRG